MRDYLSLTWDAVVACWPLILGGTLIVGTMIVADIIHPIVIGTADYLHGPMFVSCEMRSTGAIETNRP